MSNQDAVFIGWQEQGGGLKPFPLFNITKKGHSRLDSTVTALSLEKEGLKIPPFPNYTDWVRQTSGGQ